MSMQPMSRCSRVLPRRTSSGISISGRSGGIGRRAWFRSMYSQGCGGSSPFFGTNLTLCLFNIRREDYSLCFELTGVGNLFLGNFDHFVAKWSDFLFKIRASIFVRRQLSQPVRLIKFSLQDCQSFLVKSIQSSNRLDEL